MDFRERFSSLNDNQKAAVEQIYGPLLIIAGPGTGKTELLSVRAANILRETDVLPSNILCLTFTESGAVNMRERLRQIIGEQAYKVAIHTFHSFGVEIINQHREYFFRGSDYKPADELAQYQILRSMFEALDRSHPLAAQNQGDYVYLSDVRSMISEFKKSGLTVDELRQVITSNQQSMSQMSAAIADVFASKITKAVIEPFASLAEQAATLASEPLPSGISAYASGLSLSIAHAVQEAAETGKTNAITAWKNAWCTKDGRSTTVLKDSLYADKLLAVIDLYDTYCTQLDEAHLYDYDDMILNVIQAVQQHPDLKANLTEQFQFIMVDEFQDTNLAQLRLLFALTDYDAPNIMAVGDDDQAIFSFQGADVGNIQRFREQYRDPEIIVLTDNYRSDTAILTAARQVITQGQDRLEHTIADLSKELTPWFSHTDAQVTISECASEDTERACVAADIAELIADGTPAESIAVLAKQHDELIALLPHLAEAGVQVNYERRDNALEHDVVLLITQLARVIVAIRQSRHGDVDTLLPELIAHPAWRFTPLDIWKLSLSAWQNRSSWLETMQTNVAFKPFAEWLISLAVTEQTAPIEQQIDELIGLVDESHPQSSNLGADVFQRLQPEHVRVPSVKGDRFRSPLASYFFAPEQLESHPDAYLSALEALRTIRDQLRAHFDTDTPSLTDLLNLIDTYDQMNTRLTVVRNRADHQQGRVNLMTAHKSKGLEFDHVFIIGATDGRWGEKARGRTRLVPYPVNLPLQPVGNTYDERLRLFFVAMTRAKRALHISFSSTDKSAKPTLIASFISQQPVTTRATDSDAAVSVIETDWRDRLVRPVTNDLSALLAPTLENYKLSVTHLNNFLDVSRGGPQTFLINNLLRFPQAKSAKASLGTAIHTSLQHAHNTVRVDGQLPPITELLDYFSQSLYDQRLSGHDYEQWNTYGRDILTQFITSHGPSFNQNQLTELNFAGQGVVIDGARLTGALDLVDIDKQARTIRVTDYKTGKPARDWRGSTDYDKIKLHKYRQQLMFYQLLVEHSRDYAGYDFTGGVLQFVEPDAKTGDILALEDTFSAEDLDRFKQLISVVWRKITTLDLPDISPYEPSYKGMMQFEEELLADRG